MDYTTLLYKPSLISFLKSISVKDNQYKSIIDEIISSLENVDSLKYNSVYEEFYRKYKFKLLNVPSATTGLQFSLYQYDFGKSINKLVGKVSNERVVTANPPNIPDLTPVITSFTPVEGNAIYGLGCITPEPTVVFIYGRNLYPFTSLKFNGVEVLGGSYIAFPDGTEIQVAPPSGATTGPISLTTANGITTTTGSYTVTQNTCDS